MNAVTVDELVSLLSRDEARVPVGFGTVTAADGSRITIAPDSGGEMLATSFAFADVGDRVCYVSVGPTVIAIAAKDADTLRQTITVVTSTADEARSTATKAASDVRDAAIVVLSSTRGITFKSNAISTVLQVSVFQPGSPAPIETLAGLQAAYGAAAHIAWWWRKGEADEWSAIVATDSHITHDGFWFSVSADDVDGRTSFRATMDDGKD